MSFFSFLLAIEKYEVGHGRAWNELSEYPGIGFDLI